MTDEKMAEQFANNGYALGCTKTPFESAKEGYLAGLKARNNQLIKAKKIIRDWLEYENRDDYDDHLYKANLLHKAEDCVKDIIKKKKNNKKEDSETIEKKKKEKHLKEMMEEDHKNYVKHEQMRADSESEEYRKRLRYNRLVHDLNSF